MSTIRPARQCRHGHAVISLRQRGHRVVGGSASGVCRIGSHPFRTRGKKVRVLLVGLERGGNRLLDSAHAEIRRRDHVATVVEVGGSAAPEQHGLSCDPDSRAEVVEEFAKVVRVREIQGLARARQEKGSEFDT
jgi:hypothetical protein